MTETKITDIGPGDLVPEALQIKHEGYRLVQICATRTEQGFELLYSFGKEYDLYCLRINIPEGTQITSISDIFAPAFLYENEIHDLFGIQINLITIDYKGNLYRIDKKAPFSRKGE